jgi:succinate dehydrogenase / fumarate reductase iron-sulfur subunit
MPVRGGLGQFEIIQPAACPPGRQSSSEDKGKLETYQVEDILADVSFLEMLDVSNKNLMEAGQEVIEFDSDCREGICGGYGVIMNGKAHGGACRTATCQLHMRHFEDGETITVEPFRAKSFSVTRELVVD